MNTIDFGRRSGWLAMVLLSSLLSACGSRSDLAHGEDLYAQCADCHSFRKPLAGPAHCGLFGRKAGTVPGFAYSTAMRESGIVWDEKTLDEFMVSPFSYVNGTTMGFVGFSDAKDRADLIAYLKQQTSDTAVCPPQ